MYMITRKWRTHMNKNDVIQNMVKFIEDKEKSLQASKLSTDAQAKTDVVKSILDKLDEEIENENK